MKYFLLLLLPILLLGGCHLTQMQSLTEARPIASTFRGTIVAASDADQIASAYADGVLNKVVGVEDSLSYVSMRSGGPVVDRRLPVSNSVISWPAIADRHPIEPLVYVVETRGRYTGTEQRMENVYADFPEGDLITVVEHSDPAQPTILQKKSIGENLQGVSVNARGDLLVATSKRRGAELVVAELDSGRIGPLITFAIPYRGLAPDHTDYGLKTVTFHPTEDIIAINIQSTELAFYRINRRGSEVVLDTIGPRLSVAKKWSVGNWHPNGNFFLLTDVAWGEGDLGAVFNGKGALINVAFSPTGDHRIADRVKTGRSPEGFDLSPDGRYAVAVNMRRTYLPKNLWFIPARKRASLSLIGVDATTGVLTRLGKAEGFEGALPEDAIFDTESNSVAVAIYHELDEAFPNQGWIDFWEIRNDRLVKTETRVEVTRGVHNLLLLPDEL